jgi:septal ring factor EnvC (AmiA/AmiB activator)
MKRISFLLLSILSILPMQAQQIHYFDQCSEIKRFDVAMGDTVVVKCIRAVMMSESVFDLYNMAYKKMSSPAMRELIASYEGIISDQNKRIEEQKQAYDSLKKELFQVVDSSNRMIAHSTTDLQNINKNLDKVNTDLTAAKSEILNAQKSLERAVKVGAMKKILWGSGGFVVGVMLTLIL